MVREVRAFVLMETEKVRDRWHRWAPKESIKSGRNLGSPPCDEDAMRERVLYLEARVARAKTKLVRTRSKVRDLLEALDSFDDLDLEADDTEVPK